MKKTILRFIQIGGRSMKTIYTGQERHLRDERDRKLQERRQQNEERQRQIDREYEEYMNTSFTDDNNTETNTENEQNKTETPRQTLTNDVFTTALNTLEFIHKTDKPMEEVGKKQKKAKDTDDETEIKKKISGEIPNRH